MQSFIKGWLVRLNSRETLLLIAAIVLVATGQVETMQEAIALAGTIGPFVLARQYAKAKVAAAMASPSTVGVEAPV